MTYKIRRDTDCYYCFEHAPVVKEEYYPDRWICCLCNEVSNQFEESTISRRDIYKMLHVVMREIKFTMNGYARVRVKK